MSYSNPFRRQRDRSSDDANTQEHLDNEYTANGFQDVPLSTFSPAVTRQITNPFHPENNHNDDQRIDFNADTTYDPPRYMTQSLSEAQTLPYPSIDRIPQISLPATSTSLRPTSAGALDNNHRHSYLLHNDTEGAAAIEALSEPSAIFPETQDIDLVTGLRNLLGSGGFQDSWLAQNNYSQLPYPDDPDDNTEPLLRDEEQSVGLAEHTPISTIAPAAALPTTTIPPLLTPAASTLPSQANRVRFSFQELPQQQRQSTSPIRLSRLSAASTSPRKSHSSNRSQQSGRLSTGGPMFPRPNSPAADENAQESAFSRAVKNFSNRIITGDESAPPLAPERSPSPAHSYTGHDDTDDDTDEDIRGDNTGALIPLSPNSLTRREYHEGIAPSTSTESNLRIMAPLLTSSSMQSLSSPSLEALQTSQGQLSAGIVSDLTISPTSSVGSEGSSIPIPAQAIFDGTSEGGGTVPPQPPTVELFGYSLGIFSKNNRFRLFLYHKIVSRRWFHYAFLVVLIAHLGVLTALTAPDPGGPDAPKDSLFMNIYHSQAYDWVILGIFIFYTLTAIMKSIAVGLLFDSKNTAFTFTFNSKQHTIMSARKTFRNEKHELASNSIPGNEAHNATEDLPNRFRRTANIDFNKKHTVPAPERAYLRATWSRIDFIAIISYWVSFGLQANNTAQRLEFYVFRCLTGLPTLRLLNVTRRTALILRSLKVGASRIWTIFLFIAFFWTLFSIIGTQSFHESLSRTCLWINPANSSDTFNNNLVFCGSYLEPTTLERVPFIKSDDTPFSTAKGFTCPVNSVCKQQGNPYDDTISFDNIFNSLELVFVIMSLNTFSDLMYYIVDAEHLFSSIYFVIGVILLAYGLASLFISVIAASFKAVRNEFKVNSDSDIQIAKLIQHRRKHINHICRSRVGRVYHYLREIPLLIIAADLAVQSTVAYNSNPGHVNNVYYWEIFVAVFLGFELFVRFVIYLPKVGFFFKSSHNLIDFFLAICNIIIILPFVHNKTNLYYWLSCFQIVRFYRCVLAIGFIRDLWTRVLTQARIILDITIFYYLFVYIASVLGCLLLQGVIPTKEEGGDSVWTFRTLANSFLAMYIISSTENWTAILYNSVQFTDSVFSRIFVAAFLIAWFIMSNFVTINMFIAVLSENLEMSVRTKKMEQVFMFFKQGLRRQEGNAEQRQHGVKFLLKYFIPRSQRPENDKAMFERVVELFQESRLDNFLERPEEQELTPVFSDDFGNPSQSTPEPSSHNEPDSSLFWTIISPFEHLYKKLFKNNIEMQQFSSPEEYVSYIRELRQDQIDQIKNDPYYNKSLWIFSVNNKLRRFCQYLVPPGYGVRLEGQTEPTVMWNVFWGVMIVATFGLIVVAVIVTPIYFYEHLTESRMNWYVITETIFVSIFTFEVFVKVIADGFIFTPNAYLRQVWGVIDFFVWCTLIANLVQELCFNGFNSRIIRAFKALRALRLLTINLRAQELFHSIIIVGIWKLFSAALVALSLLFPFSVWGLNLFRGKMFSCNDGNFSGSLNTCVGEFANTPFNWEVLSPRVVSRPYYDFDTFGHSLLALFEIISLEGWVDILVSAMSIHEDFSQPEFNSYNVYGIFVVMYNIISTIFILTLFLSVIIQNYAKSSGSAYFTDQQLMWYELEKSIKTVRPSIRPPGLFQGTFRYKLFNLFIRPYSWIHMCMLFILFGIAIVIMSEYYPLLDEPRVIRWSFLTFLLFAYLIFLLLKCYAFGPKQYFRRKWDLYAFIVSVISCGLKIAAFFTTEYYWFLILEKLFYVAILLLIIPYSRRLDQLLKTAAASIPNMFHLLLVWAVLYFVFGIAFNQVFGMTKFGPNGSTAINFRSVPNALVLLFRMSCGEGWNQILNDYLLDSPYCYVESGLSDCGSRPYAYILFISWNIISMYIFANLLVSLIYEQFGYLARPDEPQITRTTIRQFKEQWIKFDSTARGYIDVHDLRKFLRSLDGYFSTRIHTEPWTVRTILEKSGSRNGRSVDVPTLRKFMRDYPKGEVAARRERCEEFYNHALELADDQGRIRFHGLLLLFPFYKDMDYKQCLNLRDFLHYQNTINKIAKKRRFEREAGLKEMVKEMLRVQILKIQKQKQKYTQETGSLIPTLRIGTPDEEEEDKDDYEADVPDNSTTLIDPFED